MARKKTTSVNADSPKMVDQPTINTSIKQTPKTVSPGNANPYVGYTPYKGLGNPVESQEEDRGPLTYQDIAYGLKQPNSSAPLYVQQGFATQVPYTLANNSTIIQNPSALPVTSFWQAMVSDPVIFSSMFYMITTVMSRIGDYMNPEDKEAEKIVHDAIKRVGKEKLLQHILTALWAGFSVTMKQWDVIDGVTTISDILALPPDSIMLAVTPEGRLDPEFGALHYYYNLNSGWNQNGKAYSSFANGPFARFGSYLSPQRTVAFNPMFLTAIPEKWRIVHTFNPLGMAGNFYGISLLQSLWDKICDKNNMLMKLQVAATYKAAPLVFIEADTQTQVVDEENNTTMSQAENVNRKLADGAQTGFLVVESLNSLKITRVDNTADLDQMVRTIQFYNDELRTGTVTADLVGNSGSYANAMANNKSTEVVINNITKDVLKTLDSQFVQHLIDEALGPREHYGHFEILDNSLEDKALWAKVLESSKNLGVIDPKSLDDVNFMRKRLGYPPVEKLTDDIIYGMMGLMAGADPVNMAKTKEDIKMPYANGLEKEQNDRYGRGMDT